MLNIFKLPILLFIFIALGCTKKIDQDTVIGIQPFSDFTTQEFSALKDSLAIAYDCEIIILPKAKLPERMISTIKSRRYRADSVLNWLDRHRPDSIDIMLGITGTDIAITKMDQKTGKIKTPASTYTDWAIFGLGRIRGHSCVVSSYRLKRKVNQSKYLTRFTRISNHEVGHVLGLRHCDNAFCLMNDANETIKTIDKSSGKLCPQCNHSIH